MKKQIFKLTSILLAMVMVFTLFTIIPVSAEDTAKSTAVNDFVEAWEALGSDYVGYADKVPMNYIGEANNYLDAKTDDCPPQAPESVDNRRVTLTTSDKLLLFNNYLSGSSFATERMSESAKLDDIKDLYFYYKSDCDISTLINPIANDGTTRINRGFGTRHTLNRTGDDWVKVSFMEYLTEINYSFDRLVNDFRTINGGNQNVNNLSTIGFKAKVEGGTADFYVSELFVCTGIDKNLVGTDSFTSDQWIEKAASLDLDTLKKDYDTTTDSAKWDAFVAAYNVVKPYFTEKKLREAAVEMITSETSYAYPIQIGRKFNAYTQNDKDVDLFGDYYYSGLIEGQTSIDGTSAGKGVWLTNQAGRGEAGTTTQTNAELYFGSMGSDPYFVVNVTDIADPSKTTKIGFYIRMLGANANSGYVPTYYKDIPTEGEYRIYIKDIFKDTVYENWETESIKGASNSFYATIMAATVVGSDITATVGSIVDTPNYSIPADIAAKSGSDFVAEMGVLDISKYGNTEAFNAALKAALDAHPEAAKIVAVEELRVAAGKMLTYGDSILHPAKFWVTNRQLSAMESSATPKYGEYSATYTVPNVGTMADLTLTGQWLTYPGDLGTRGDTDNTLNVSGTGDAYITIKVNSINGADTTKLRFRYRAKGATINQLLSFTLPVVAKKEYTFSLTELFAGSDAAEWKTFFATNGFNFLVIAAEGAEANITVGSVVLKTNYKPSSETGVEFVKAMKALKEGDSYASYSNTTEFEEALGVALEAFPEIEEEEARKAALDKLRAEWKAMREEPVVYSDYYHHSFWGSNATNINPTKTNTEYGSTITVTGITSSDYVGVGKTGKFLHLYQRNNNATDINLSGKSDIGYWYKATSDIKAKIYLMFNLTGLSDTYVEGTLIGDGEWHYLSVKDWIGETVWNNVVKSYGNETFHRVYTDLGNIVDPGVPSVEVTFGGLYKSVTDTYVATITDDNLVSEAIKVNTDNYADAAAFNAALTKALDYYSDLKIQYNKDKVINELRDEASKLIGYGNSVMVPSKTYTTANKRVPTDMIASETANYGSKTATIDIPTVPDASFDGSTVDGIWFDVDDGIASSDAGFQIGKGITNEAYLTFRVNSIEDDAASTQIRFRVRGGKTADECLFNSASTTILTVKKGEEYTISLSDMLKGTGADNWQEYFTDNYFNFLCMTALDTAANITVGSVVYKNICKPSDATGINFLKEMYLLNADDYLNTEAFNAKLEEAIRLFGEEELLKAKAAKDVIDSAADYTFEATVYSHDAVLAEAREINTSEWDKATADTFKKAVKALEDIIDAEVVEFGSIAGNWYEGKLTIKDLSVLSRYVDAVVAGNEAAFLEANFIDLDCANIDGDENGEINEDDIIALRKKLLGIPDES